ncbi:MAG: class I SAM-dependent methyltransferase [Deltaproteobacteria bacterium]|nr:class I SAM-dependent methyltransferase [Deltaproteobacteria bacterium]
MENFLSPKINLNEKQMKATNAHLNLLLKWKKVHNLTSLIDLEDLYKFHYLDCFLGLKTLESLVEVPGTIFDLGSGPGFPGLLAAVYWPDKEVNLVESSSKKCSFLKLACSEMNLHRTNVLGQRAEALRGINFAITRATFSEKTRYMMKACLAPKGKVACWVSEQQATEFKQDSQKKAEWVLEKEGYYELEPGHRRGIMVFHVKQAWEK